MTCEPLKRSLAWGLALTLSALPCLANDLGQQGPVFPIGEIDMSDWIAQRLHALAKSGRLDALARQAQDRAQRYIDAPPGVALPTATESRVFAVDPSLTLIADILDPLTGRLIAKRGTTLNPFDPTTWPGRASPGHTRPDGAPPSLTLHKTLVFLNARDPRQRAWAHAVASGRPTDGRPIKWIVTGGRPAPLSNALGAPVYADQHGALARRLHLTHVPAIARQVGTHWQIQEVAVAKVHPTPPRRPQP